MKQENKIFYYSDKNNREFCLPEKFSRYIEKAGAGAKKTHGGKKTVKAKPKKKKKKAFDVSVFIRIAALIVMVASLGIIADKSLDYMRDIRFNKAISEKFDINAKPNELLSKRETPIYPTLPEGEEIPRLDYPNVLDPESIAQMATAYKDFRFYIYMPMKNSDIKLPVVQAADNDYYLKRNINGGDNLSGTLFLDYRNDFSTLRHEDEEGILQRNNIVYGHNMQNGTMFGTLKEYTDRAFFNSNNMIYTYSATEVIAWKIFSAYETTTDNYYIDTNFVSDEEYTEFINKLKSDSMHPSDVTLNAESDILTLSTCHNYETSNGRFVVHAVKVSSSPLV